ncbi:MAG: hypothetical protein HDQ95_07800 [Roseburia sp.]|nr:hypothetical protein [Roseburia sp.]
MDKKLLVLFGVFFAIVFGGILVAYQTRPDPELNAAFSPIDPKHTYYRTDSQYFLYYEHKFQDLPVDAVSLSVGLHWFVERYDEVYTGKRKYFYESAFEGWYTKDVLKLYYSDNEKYYYLKPFLDCYLLMDEDYRPSDSKMETIKETILYALEYYCNGEDFVGTLDESET